MRQKGLLSRVRQCGRLSQVCVGLGGEQIHLFGSAANGTALVTGNHIDVCIEIPELGDEQARDGP